MKLLFRIKPKLWVILALAAMTMVVLVVGGTIFFYRVVLENRYSEHLRRQMQRSADALEDSGFSAEAAVRVQNGGVWVLIVRERDDTILFRSSPERPLFRIETADADEVVLTRQEKEELRYLHHLIGRHLGDRESRKLVMGPDLPDESDALDVRDMFLLGRKDGVIYSLYLPVESTNAAINLAIRYSTIAGVGGTLIGVLIFYLLSRAITHPHRDIVRTAGKIAELDFSCRCDPVPVRELDDLSRSINTMADRLQSAVAELQGANLQLQQDLTERTMQQKQNSALLANLSHDLKTPIAIISGYAEGLQEGVARTPEQQEKYYSMILTESEHMSRIVSRMLSSTRLDSETVPLVIEDFDLAALLDEVLGMFQLEIDRAGLELETDYDRPLMARTDYESIRQSVINYVQNAVYHINHGKRIRVSTERDGEILRLSVVNSSEPIRQAELSRIWEKLYRGDYARQRSHGEAGLGLAIVRGNMERLGLDYGCRNLPDNLVEFWLCVPAVPAQSGQIPIDS